MCIRDSGELDDRLLVKAVDRAVQYKLIHPEADFHFQFTPNLSVLVGDVSPECIEMQVSPRDASIQYDIYHYRANSFHEEPPFWMDTALMRRIVSCLNEHLLLAKVKGRMQECNCGLTFDV